MPISVPDFYGNGRRPLSDVLPVHAREEGEGPLQVVQGANAAVGVAAEPVQGKGEKLYLKERKVLFFLSFKISAH